MLKFIAQKKTMATLAEHLRSSTPVFLDSNQVETTLELASTIKIGSVSCSPSSPSGFLDYPIFSVLYLIKNKLLNHQDYILLTLNLKLDFNAPAISFIHRKDLLDYLDGKESSFMTSSKKVIVDVYKQAVDQDRPIVARVLERERLLRTRKTIMKSFGNRNFSNINKIAQNLMKKTTTSKPIQTKKPKTKIPIIIIPAGLQSSISLFNANDFLINKKYIETTPLSSKPLSVTITRQSSNHNTPLQYMITDSVDNFTSSDWDRVVAVFASGHEWQFKNWKVTKPVDVFDKWIGFCLLFNDEIVKECVKGWNVKVLSIHRNKRHLDGQIVFDFWNYLDDYISTRRPDMCEKFN